MNAPKHDRAWLETAHLLWPDIETAPMSQRSRSRRLDRTRRDFVFLPSADRPRLLVPANAPRATASALRRYSHGLGRGARIGRSVLATALGTGIPEYVLPGPLRAAVAHSGTADGRAIETHLASLLGDDVFVSLQLGNPRANRKPVLHAMTVRGESLAFVKVGDTDVARGLIRAEAAALERMACRDLARVAAPRVLHYGAWRDVHLLVLSPLTTTARRWKGRGALPLDAMKELSAVDGHERQVLRETPFWAGLIRTPPRIIDREAGDRLAEVLHRVEGTYGSLSLDMGAWHGDWTPWNMAWHRETVQLWDWERFAMGVPHGFDALHYRLHDALRSAGLRRSVLDTWWVRAEGTLAELGVTDDSANATTTVYLIELCRRYLLAAQESIGAPVRPRARFLLGFLHDKVNESAPR